MKKNDDIVFNNILEINKQKDKLRDLKDDCLMHKKLLRQWRQEHQELLDLKRRTLDEEANDYIGSNNLYLIYYYTKQENIAIEKENNKLKIKLKEAKKENNQLLGLTDYIDIDDIDDLPDLMRDDEETDKSGTDSSGTIKSNGPKNDKGPSF